jgi:hypothetical protein
MMHACDDIALLKLRRKTYGSFLLFQRADFFSKEHKNDNRRSNFAIRMAIPKLTKIVTYADMRVISIKKGRAPPDSGACKFTSTKLKKSAGVS